MPDPQDNGNTNANTNGNAGGNAGGSQGTEKTTYTAEEHRAELQREADRRVSEAQRKWREQLDATVADKTKDAESKLAELTGKASEAEARATFAEEASSQGVTDVRAAYAVAKAEGLIKDGKPDWKKLQSEHPALFGKPRVTAAADPADAGPKQKPNMTQLLKAAAGVGGTQ